VSEGNTENNQEARRHWMGVLARASVDDLEDHWVREGEGVDYSFLRPPETGLVMTQGRAGGTGQRFNLGEMTVTRCAVRLSEGIVGHAYVMGRDRRHAELAAAFDALMQSSPGWGEIQARVIQPLADKFNGARELRSRKAAATKVDFYTMVRGEDLA
tara:strand:- start:441 stop:911 length:471 start_codon:yes stop_codon:yes gene_type:complete